MGPVARLAEVTSEILNKVLGVGTVRAILSGLESCQNPR